MRYFDAFRFDETHSLLWQENVRVPLTAKACAVLNCLIDAGERAVSKEEILRTVWQDTHVTPENVKVLVREIRRALGDDVRAPRYIRTIGHAGYTFIAPVHKAAPSTMSRGRTIFAGRRGELAALTWLLPAGAEQPRAMALVTGTAGIGKSALVDRLLDAADERGCLVLRAQCVPSSTPVEPYYSLLDTFDRLIAAVPRAAEVIGPHAPALLQHLGVPPPLRIGDEMQKTAATSRLLREMVAAFEALSYDTPLVLALEDVQWLSAGDVDVLGALARRRHPARLTIVATARPLTTYPAAEPLRQLIGELEIAGVCTVMQLGVLPPIDVDLYTVRRFGQTVAMQVGKTLYNASGGQPLLLNAAADALVQRGLVRRHSNRWVLEADATEVAVAVVGALGDIMEWQVEQLSRDERHLLASVSSLGLEFSTWKAARILERDPATVAELLDHLARRGDIIAHASTASDPNDPSYRFTNPMYLEVLNSTAAAVAS
jgi:DNA-binding winged helix-turn-helix (wHTH) protein/predicted ATPase